MRQRWLVAVAGLALACADPDEGTTYVPLPSCPKAVPGEGDPYFPNVFLGDRAHGTASVLVGCEEVRRIVVGRVDPPFGTDLPASGLEVPPDAWAVTIPFWFEPTEPGVHAAEVWFVLETDSGMLTRPVVLKGIGVEPTLDCEQDTVDLGIVATGGGRSRWVSCNNWHGSAIEVRLDDLEGDGAQNFAARFADEGASPAAAREVPPGGVVDIDLTLLPSVAGEWVATLPLRRTNGRADTLATIALTGVVSENRIVTFPKTCLDFGYVSQEFGGQRSWTVQNVGGAPATIRGAAIEGDAKSEYELNAEWPAEIAPGQYRTIRVSFTPESEGWREATVVFDTDDGPIRRCVRGLGRQRW